MSDIAVRSIEICDYAIDLAQQYYDRALGLVIELGIPLAEEYRSLKNELESTG